MWLEAEGIGRPSTYAPTISTIQDRNYIEKNDKRQFIPTEMGITVNDLLVEHFPEIVDIKFTANMEERLDEISRLNSMIAVQIKKEQELEMEIKALETKGE